MPDYFIGIDGGGTKSKLVFVNKNLEILSQQNGGGTNLLSAGIENAAKVFLELIEKSVVSANITLDEIKGIAVGAAGAGRPGQAEALKVKLLNYFQSKKNIKENMIVTSDAEIALKGAFPNGDGIILIAGTGSILYGKNNDGKFFRVGGMGKLIGDEGSGYSIGKKGLSLVSKMFDGREKDSLLFHIFRDEFSITNQAQIIEAVYNSNFNVAGFAECLIEAASKGDEHSSNILDEESDELVKHITAIIKLLNTDNLKLTFSGSLLSTGNYYSDMLKRKISSRYKDINLCSPQYPPEIGAVILSIENSKLTDAI